MPESFKGSSNLVLPVFPIVVGALTGSWFEIQTLFHFCLPASAKELMLVLTPWRIP